MSRFSVEPVLIVMRLFVRSRNFSPLVLTGLVLACSNPPLSDGIDPDSEENSPRYLDGTPIYHDQGDGDLFIVGTGGETGVIVLPTDYGMAGAPVYGDGDSSTVGTGGTGVNQDIDDKLPEEGETQPSGSGRCEFEYSSCVRTMFDVCETDEECDLGVDSCVSRYEACTEDEPECASEVSSCFTVAENCIARLGDDATCADHYGFCLNLAEECFGR